MTQDTMRSAGGGHAGWRLALWGGAALLLLAPWVAMRFTAQVDWSAGDFLVFGAMLALACGACELAAWTLRRRALRLAAWAAIALAFGLVWAELAVGLFGPG